MAWAISDVESTIYDESSDAANAPETASSVSDTLSDSTPSTAGESGRAKGKRSAPVAALAKRSDQAGARDRIPSSTTTMHKFTNAGKGACTQTLILVQITFLPL
jgi:hypothetical protein